MTEKYNLITFENTHSSIAADNLLDDRGIDHKLIAIPGEITAGCGFCIRVAEDSFEQAVTDLKSEAVDISGLYHMERFGLRSSIERLEYE